VLLRQVFLAEGDGRATGGIEIRHMSISRDRVYWERRVEFDITGNNEKVSWLVPE
jgi:hypothetical protein